MIINSPRLGRLEITSEDILNFPQGLIGFEDCRSWVVVADPQSEGVAWLQNLERPDLAVAVTSPRRHVPNYQVRTRHEELGPLNLSHSDHIYVLAIISKNHGRLTLNLRAPVMVNLDQRLGRQIVTADEQPLQLILPHASDYLRKSA